MLEQLQSGAALLGRELSQAQVSLFERYRAELLLWNQRMNLTAITDPVGVELRHFLDSLTVLAALGPHEPSGTGLRLLDVGSGAGLPGVPLSIVLPEARVTLLEATGKKAAFLSHLVELLSLSNAQVLPGRAEEHGRDSAHRGRYDVVVARAVAPLAALAELCLPFAAIGGLFVAMKKGDLTAELSDAAAAVAEMGGSPVRVVDVTLPSLADGRCLVVSTKTSPTPGRYPRRPGVPAASPVRHG